MLWEFRTLKKILFSAEILDWDCLNSKHKNKHYTNIVNTRIMAIWIIFQKLTTYPWSFLDNFLMSSLYTAISFKQVDCIAMLISKYLNFYVPVLYFKICKWDHNTVHRCLYLIPIFWIFNMTNKIHQILWRYFNFLDLEMRLIHFPYLYLIKH